MPVGCQRFVLVGVLLLGSHLPGIGGETVSGPFKIISSGSRAEIVRNGEDLERSRQWADAIQHYEHALKQFPNDDDLKLGLRRAKIHFGVNRRYADSSFQSDLLAKSPYQLSVLTDELLLKIKTHFVDDLSLTWLVAHGTESLYYALANDSFLKKNLLVTSTEFAASERKSRISRFREILRTEYWNKPIRDRDAAHATIGQVADTAGQVVGLSRQCVFMEYVFGFCNALDDYSDFLTPDRLSDLYDTIDGNFVGIGIEMKAERGQGLLLVNVLPDSPAADGGARPGDHIVLIDGIDCREMTTDEAANLLRGPPSSRVRIQLVGSAPSDVRNATLIRRQVHIKSISVAEIINDRLKIGYIKMTGFQKSSPEELDAALISLQRQGMRALIWDLRGNPGGLLTAAVEVLDRFVEHGVLVSTRGRTRDQNWSYQAHQPSTLHIPLVLLTDGESASASEIVAGAIRDHRRGTIVGRKTYGKWSVQSIFPIRDATGLRLTTAKFFSPEGHTYGKIGIRPDVVVDLGQKHRVHYRPTAKNPGEDEDPDVQKGLEVLSTQLTAR